MNLLYGVARAGFCVAALSIGTGAGAWSNHALCTWQALAVMPEITRLPAVPAEELDTFLAGESAGLAHPLADEELWARQHVPNYPARPDALAFAARPDAGANPMLLPLRRGLTLERICAKALRTPRASIPGHAWACSCSCHLGRHWVSACAWRKPP